MNQNVYISYIYIDILTTHLLKVIDSFNDASYFNSESFTDNVVNLHELLFVLTIYNFKKRDCIQINKNELHTCKHEIEKLFALFNTRCHLKKNHIKNIIDDIIISFSSMIRSSRIS